MKKKIKFIIILLSLCVLLKICYENIYEENFKNKYGLSSELVVLEEDEATIVSLATGEFDNIPLSCIGDKLKGTDVLQCNGKIYYRGNYQSYKNGRAGHCKGRKETSVCSEKNDRVLNGDAHIGQTQLR